MENIGRLIAQKNRKSHIEEKKSWDEKSIFFAFQRIIREEYGNQGVKNLVPDFWKGGRLFVRTESSVWASELQLKREELRRKINQELGNDEVREIKIKN